MSLKYHCERDWISLTPHKSNYGISTDKIMFMKVRDIGILL